MTTLRATMLGTHFKLVAVPCTKSSLVHQMINISKGIIRLNDSRHDHRFERYKESMSSLLL